MHPKPDDISDSILVTENISTNQKNNQGKSPTQDEKQSSENSEVKDEAPNLIQLDG